MDEEKINRSTTTNGEPPIPGYENDVAPGPVQESSGMHTAYWVLTEEERAKGFVRPVRNTYVHVGPPRPKYELRDLTGEEKERYGTAGYVVFEIYPEDSPLNGRYWTQEDLDKAGQGCGRATMMGRAIAETYAREPHYYGSTFCAGCRDHLPVGKFGEFVWDGTDERVGT